MDKELSPRERFSASPVTRAAVAFLLVVVIGTCAFYISEQWSAWQSLFFTLVTITTVGYGDYGLSQQGEKVAAVLMHQLLQLPLHGLDAALQAAVAKEFGAQDPQGLFRGEVARMDQGPAQGRGQGCFVGRE